MFHHRKFPIEYQTWQSMKGRCKNPNNKAYRFYGARGISVCPQWEDFEVFFKDMGKRPSDKHSIDRIDSNGNYEPENCRWVTWDIQIKNRRNQNGSKRGKYDVKKYEALGMSKTLVEWAEHTGIKYLSIRERLKRGWSMEDCITRPFRKWTSKQKSLSSIKKIGTS